MAELYGVLAALTPSPVVELSRAGHTDAAARAYQQAIALTANAVERAEL